MIRVVRAKGLICTSSVSGSINLGGWNVVSGDAWSGGAGAGDGLHQGIRHPSGRPYLNAHHHHRALLRR